MGACRWSVTLALILAACSGEAPPRRPAERESPDVASDMRRQDGAEVVFRPTGKPEARVAVELARTPRATQVGLMYRTHLPPDAGMLFLFRRPRVLSFWMKNTLIPLDMIFVSSGMVVVGVVENAAPETLTRRKLQGVVSQFVVEVNAGWARAHGIEAGVPAEFIRVAPLAPGEGG